GVVDGGLGLFLPGMLVAHSDKVATVDRIAKVRHTSVRMIRTVGLSFAVVCTAMGPARAGEALGQVEGALLAGRYTEVEPLARRVDGKRRAEAEAMAGEALRKTGRYAEARKLLEATVARDPKALRARLELGRVYRLTGQTALAKAEWNRFYDDY